MSDTQGPSSVQYDDEPITVCDQRIEFPHAAAPHDPKFGPEGRTTKDGQPCNRDCEGEWPCVERRVQREVLHEIARTLRDTLYTRTAGRGYAEWTNPLGLRARYGYGETGLWFQVLGIDGKPYAQSLHADAYWAAQHV